MPFELGLAVAWEKLTPSKHTWFAFESKLRRAEKALSDLNGTDVDVHHGRPHGVFRELCNAFVRTGRQPSVQQISFVYNGLEKDLPKIMKNAGT